MTDPAAIGPNAWLVDEMRERFDADPASVDGSWRALFTNGEGPAADDPKNPGASAPQPVAPTTDPKKDASAPKPATPAGEPAPSADSTPGEVIRGVGARIVENMEASLEIPTATSFREVPARLLEVNRGIVNGYLGRSGGGKVSYTHLIGYAVVRAVADHVPRMNAVFHRDAEGAPRVERPEHVGLGIAVDIEKSDGSRSLLVPCIRDADTLDFAEFVDRYEKLIGKVRANKLSPDDFAGTTVTLTNPGTIGTYQSVPRLMPGQGLIVGVGAINYPTGFQAADRHTLAEIGVSRVVTLTSTYDHRIIQGAESGLFLKTVQELLLGDHDFYADAFRAIGVPYEAVKWRTDVMPTDREDGMLEKQVMVNTLVHMYRVRGHLIANLDPLGLKGRGMHAELDPATYGLTIWDLEREFLATGLLDSPHGDDKERHQLADILKIVRDAYCRSIGVEYMHIQEYDEKRWIQQQVEGVDTSLELDEKLHILDRLNAAEAFEKFLAAKYVGQKRFGLEGAESAIPILDALLGDAADAGLDSAVMGMAHRGRLNVLVNIVGKSFEKLFGEFEGQLDATSIQGSGDVKYHLGQTGTFRSRNDNEIRLDLAANPSHLEAVDPVVIGMARARLDELDNPPGDPVLPLLVHGDAAFAGQGVVAETLAMSQIPGYRVGGTVHLIVNNQVGFTTTPDAARSSTYATDVARMVQAPIFHVNGDDPEACVRVAHLAFEYRQRFRKDVVIDMWCYRRHGHNEGDDPSYTQPLMYRRIEEKRTVRELYVESLVARGDISSEEEEQAMESFRSLLQSKLEMTRDRPDEPSVQLRQPRPRGVLPPAQTAVSREVLDRIYAALATVPDDFTVHPKLARQFETRDARFHDDEVADWAMGEAFAFGSLLLDGVSVRVAGQDSRRGTFSHRHSTLVDNRDETEYQPLTALAEPPTRFRIYDSLLSEYAALGFEYGYTVTDKNSLVVWEAQFGDFVNGAQIIIDQFIVAAEDKWKQTSGLVMLLPHGYEGQGPEHSSGRIERFLILCAEDNIQVAYPSTASQLFHVLRRQMVRDVRKPLVMFTPKSLLRARSAQSPLSEFTHGTFREVLPDPHAPEPETVERIVFCTGKVGHDAISERDESGAVAAVVRVEQLYPWPTGSVAEQLAEYPNAREIVWLQEEPENMGAWNFVKGHLYGPYEDTHRIWRVSRAESGAPATGSARIHAAEQSDLLSRAFAAD
ncbi:MAG: multifunctional oxoglutarate decarboxylase/oxoglutarate dehydrogenase thiamine pyrophosphate-binding subunit/dihydrolipoyllysine-residue succinyltransferase subunit [Acidimicrobiales bacterium]